MEAPPDFPAKGNLRNGSVVIVGATENAITQPFVGTYLLEIRKTISE